MANFNKVILAGNLTRDPQMSALPSGTPVAEFGMAINRTWRTPDGQSREEVCFVDCSCFGRQAETLTKYMKKGNPLLVEGRLKYEAWESKDGQKRSRLRVVVDHFQFLSSRRDSAEGGTANYAGSRGPRAASASMDEPPPPRHEEDVGEPGGDHVPF